MKSLFILSLIIFTFLSWKFIDPDQPKNDLDPNSIQIRMRDIGHQLLLRSGDSTSRVLPVKVLSNSDYQIKFESELALVPDTLVNIVHSHMKGFYLSRSYVVNVRNCSTKEIVYGFEIYQEKDKDIIPCLGRYLPMDCYEIAISFQGQSSKSFSSIYLIISLMVSVAFGFVVLKTNKSSQRNRMDSNFIVLGKMQFFHDKQMLILDKQEIELTSKENHVLYILASNPNEIVSREQLQKEVWEDDGVLVGRSLDVFISKLRKKLEVDSSIRIVNVHGKGYKLEI